MVFPGVYEHSGVSAQRRTFAAHNEGAVSAACFEQDVAMVMRMAHERRVHVEQSDTAETTLVNLDGGRHS